ncbi:amidase [Rhodococcus jostii]|uniref:Aspartyl-tRNA(Asn)/glutamyl-tRNA(Gln) amidotransferase subunit A n=1 Tax=Rhodococcus jostii TaxID=132919 RepID=A0A1H5EXK5_RHOJO|nr:amidase [Rhodococcus jostii]SED95783.1 aspartyl-tRNA(Asn)/glutamyl-tRNA(Gln) amidotransferase subunit A [Rhodococcus jostii]
MGNKVKVTNAEALTQLPLSIAEAADALRNGITTSADLVRCALDRADRLDPLLGVYIRRFDDDALRAAQQADRDRQRGVDLGPLHGIPLAIKDMLTTEEGPTTAQSLVPDDEAQLVDAAPVAALRRAGAVILGKTTLMEYSKGYPDLTAPFPFPHNPWSLDHWTGGSSSGMAGGTAAGLFLGGLGTDSGGSIRLPSSYTGITGHKPTYDLVPRTGLLRLSESLDHVGPMGRSARDCALLLEAITDQNSFRAESITQIGLEGLPIIVDPALVSDAVTADVIEAFQNACAVLERLGGRIVHSPVPGYAALSEAASVIAAVEARETHAARLASGAPYSPATIKTLLQHPGLTPRDYALARRTVGSIRTELIDFLGNGILLTPTAPYAPATVEAVRAGAGLLPPTFTRAWNAVGFPATSVPMGFDSAGLPIGLQIVSVEGRDDLALGVGHAYQQHTSWHRATPPLTSVA